MDHADESLEEQLRVLRRQYLEQSSQRVEELQRLRGRVGSGERAALAELRQALHKLAGSGGSYGFPVVSARSREGERLAQGLEAAGAAVGERELAALDACIRDIAEAFRGARESPGTGPGGSSPR